ncbi:MAG: ABC transporter substrate-binding protein [Coleofasciculus sp. S288]|nr:ABC transporter substrate-binding protein [Coleofasciculus sp. S288]
MPQKKESLVLLMSLMITILLVWMGLGWLTKRSENVWDSLVSDQNGANGTLTNADRQQAIVNRLSTGETILIPGADSSHKQAGVAALAAGNDEQAIAHFEAALQENRNDPEALIYLNNARIGQQKAYTIAAVIPSSGSNPNNALEMLRGFAQAQHEVNRSGGINGVPLKVLIADDSDNPEIATQIATTLVQNPDVLAVTGHWTSDVSLAAASVYDSSKLVFIAPVSTTVKLSNLSPYVFRTTINNYTGARALANYMLTKLQRQKVAIFFLPKVTYSQELKSEFAAAVSLGGGEVVAEFDLSDPGFSAAHSVKQATERGAEVLMLATNNTAVDKALQVVQVNNKRLGVLGDVANLYTSKTLEVGGHAADGMVMAVPWHIEGNSQSTFPHQSRQLWGADVNGVTAMSYDALQALIAALKRNPTRAGIQQALSASDFSAMGSAKAMRFLSSGDVNSPVQMVKVSPANPSRSGTGYDFVPVSLR